MPVPVFRLSANGKDITENIRDILVSATIVDTEGLQADTLEVVVNDLNGSVEAPKTGAILNPIGGFEGNLRDFGLFEVDTVAFNGWPQTISINAKAVAAKSVEKERTPKSYPPKDYPTYGDIFQYVADRVGLKLEMAAELKSIANPYEAQTEEDATGFLTRISEKIGAMVTVKSQRIVVLPKGSAKSASGGPLDVVVVKPGLNLLSYALSLSDVPAHSKVEATYYDRKKNTKEKIEVETGDEGPTFLLRAPYSDPEEAKRAAEAKAKDLKRAKGDLTLELDGTPFAQPEALAAVSGCRPEVDGSWRIKSATHNFGASSPYTTTLQCEAPNEKSDDNA